MARSLLETIDIPVAPFYQERLVLIDQEDYSGVEWKARDELEKQGRVVTDPDWSEQQGITLAEKCGAGLLIFATLIIGLYPRLLLDRIMPAVEAMRFLTK